MVKGSEISPQDSSRLRVEVSLWVSWLNASVSKQFQANIQLSTQYIRHIKDMRNKHKQDINTSEREKESNRKHERFVLRIEHPCSTSPPSTL